MRTELYWIEGPWPGRLAIMPRPRGGDWLEDEIQSWRQAGVDIVLSLLEASEIAELGLSDEGKLCGLNGIEYCTFPIPDRDVPASRESSVELAMRMAELLADGKNLAVHCRQGIGRAALVAIAILIGSGIDRRTAVSRASAARGRPVPEMLEQHQWLANFAELLLEEASK